MVMFYKIIKQRLVKGMLLDEDYTAVKTKEEAKEMVERIRKEQGNQLCYYQEVRI